MEFQKLKPDLTRRRFMQSAAALLALGPGGNSFSRAVPVRYWREYLTTRHGAQLHVHCAEPRDSAKRRHRPLVCFHPTPYSGRFFAEFQALMAKDRWVICPDTPGFGNSDKPVKIPTIADYAEAMADALDELGFGAAGSGQVDVLGFHTGCFIATELAVLYPDLVDHLVLPGIPYEQGAKRTEALEMNAKEEAYFSDPDKFTEMWNERWEWLGDNMEQPRLLELLGDELRSGPDHWWAYQAVFTYDADARLPLVKQPTLAIATEGDLFEPTIAAAKLMPNAIVEKYPELDIPLFNKHYAAMNDIVRRFLATN